MSLTRYFGARPNPQENPFDQFLDQVLNHSWDEALAPARFSPAVDVQEAEGEYLFKAETPGLRKEDVRISILDNVLTLSGEKKSEEKKENRKYHRSERTYGAFERKYSLASPIQADKVTASYKDGILEIRVPKAEEAKPKEIQVQVD